MNRYICVVAVVLFGLAGCSQTQTRGQIADEALKEEQDIKAVKTIGDITEVGSINPTPISAVGLVCNLDDTGGGAPVGPYRKMLEDLLHKKKVEHVQELLASTAYAMVLVNGEIPPGTRKGDYLDLQVIFPPQSRATSLRGGILYECDLMDYAIGHNSKGNEHLLEGHTLAHGGGPLVVGFGDGNDEDRVKRGFIWADSRSHSGAISLIDAPFCLWLKDDQKYAAVANTVTNRINAAFPDDAMKQFRMRQIKQTFGVTSAIAERFPAANSLGRGQLATTTGKDVINVNVPVEYRLNPERYIRVVRNIPLQEEAQTMANYRKRLHEMLLDPKETVLVALRLEALGKESVPALKKGLASNDVLVRFASAEALTYLGRTDGIEELSRLAQRHETLRGNCLIAMASLNESCSLSKLMDLLKSPVPEVRIGAFAAIGTMNDINLESATNPELRGELLSNSFWLHHVAVTSSPLVHVSTVRRAEVVIFGDDPGLVPPFKISFGDYIVSAMAEDPRPTLTHYIVKPNGGYPSRQCASYKVEDVLRKIAEMGGQYTDVVNFLQVADQDKCLSCATKVDTQIGAASLALLTACGSDGSLVSAEAKQEVLAAQRDLGIVPRPAPQVAGAKVARQ